MADANIDTEFTDLPVCPRCGEADRDWWDGLRPDVTDGSTWERDCGRCGRAYRVTLTVLTRFTTAAEEP